MTKEKRISADDERIGPLSNEHRKDIVEIALGGGAQDIELECKRGCGLLHLLDLHSGIRIVRVYQQTHRSDFGHEIAQQFQPFCTQGHRQEVAPVTFPPGRLRLTTSPVSTGSLPIANTIGMVAVAAFAASAAGIGLANSTDTCRPTRSAAIIGNRS